LLRRNKIWRGAKPISTNRQPHDREPAGLDDELEFVEYWVVV